MAHSAERETITKHRTHYLRRTMIECRGHGSIGNSAEQIFSRTKKIEFITRDGAGLYTTVEPLLRRSRTADDKFCHTRPIDVFAVESGSGGLAPCTGGA